MKIDIKHDENKGCSLYVEDHRISWKDKTLWEYEVECNDDVAYERDKITINLKQNADGVYYLYIVGFGDWDEDSYDYTSNSYEVFFPSSADDLLGVMESTDDLIGILDWEAVHGDSYDEDDDKPYEREFRFYNQNGKLIRQYTKPKQEQFIAGLKEEGFVGKDGENTVFHLYSSFVLKRADRVKDLIHYLAYKEVFTPDVIKLIAK